ncbi:MAG: NUDIX domain-containing protein [Rhodanobacteraceae bacterium]|nr:MAG: NUDIX domain-containing protein [Rhodanobacteraceae bacterium]
MVIHPGPAASGIPVRCTMVSVLALRGSGAGAQVLLLRRAGPYLQGAWSYVAGHVEDGETGAQAALRELGEETGLVPTAFYATSFCEQVYFTAAIEIVPAFVARIAAGAEPHLNPEHSAYQWLTVDAAANAVPFGSQRDLIAHVRREFIERTPAAVLRIDGA